MNETKILGTVKELWRFPIKSMRGERLEIAHIGEDGLLGDRAFALLDVQQDKIVTAKSLKRFPTIFEFRAFFAEEPMPGEPLPPVTVELPGGGDISSTARGFDQLLSARLGQEVRLIRVGERESVPYHDASPLSVLTQSTLNQLREFHPDSDFDVRRFRMNIIVDSDQAGFVENDWVDQNLVIGKELRLHVTGPNARCVMTTLAQEDLPADREIFTTMVKHNRLEMQNKRLYPCAGVYARIISPGSVSIGDPVES